VIESIETGRAITWVSDSLAQGSRLSRIVQSRVHQMKYATILGAPEPVPYELDNRRRGVSSIASDSDAVRFLEASRKLGFHTLLVEDDMARKGDPHLPKDSGFIEDRVLRWTEIRPGARAAAHLLRDASAGFPLNAFIVRRSVGHMNAVRGRQLDSVVESVGADVGGVIVAVFDGESFLTMTADEVIIRT